ncbi:hypothetical protein AB3R30_23670 [Leptolyngbyaceae cyanobacterium UHCC 1019]
MLIAEIIGQCYRFGGLFDRSAEILEFGADYLMRQQGKSDLSFSI